MEDNQAPCRSKSTRRRAEVHQPRLDHPSETEFCRFLFPTATTKSKVLAAT